MIVDWQFTDRYEALGIPRPDPTTVCHGDCEGTGAVPIYVDKPELNISYKPSTEIDSYYLDLWHKAELLNSTDDGWHFVICKDCQGTGLKNG